MWTKVLAQVSKFGGKHPCLVACFTSPSLDVLLRSLSCTGRWGPKTTGWFFKIHMWSLPLTELALRFRLAWNMLSSSSRLPMLGFSDTNYHSQLLPLVFLSVTWFPTSDTFPSCYIANLPYGLLSQVILRLPSCCHIQLSLNPLKSTSKLYADSFLNHIGSPRSSFLSPKMALSLHIILCTLPVWTELLCIS